MAIIDKDLGRAIFIYKGDYNTTVSYEKMDMVNYDLKCYWAKKDVPSGTPVTDTTYWALLSDGNALILALDKRIVKLEDLNLGGRVENIENSPGAANGYAQLDENKKLVFEQLPEIDKDYVGLGNVENYAPDDLPINYTVTDAVETLTAGEKISEAFGKIAKAVSELKPHLLDVVKHITADERKKWNDAAEFTSTFSYDWYEMDDIEEIADMLPIDVSVIEEDTDMDVPNTGEEGDGV